MSVFGGVSRKFSLVKIPILRHGHEFFPIFSYGEKNVGQRGGHGRFGQGVIP